MKQLVIETSITQKIEDLKECSICGTNGKMEGKVLNNKTYVWICDTCPAVLFEYQDYKNTDDLYAYLEQDTLK
jgi:ribosomal protein L37AE/L43A